MRRARSRRWTGPRRSCPFGLGSRRSRTHDYVRHGTTTLFAALEVATGKVTDACYPRRRNEEFLTFLKQVAKAYPRRQLHIVVDNYATHKHDKVTAWLSKSFYEPINPGNSLTGTVVFDVPVDAVPASLELHDSAFSGGVTVALS